jgi:excisionase family DNA binding protein
MDVTAQEAARLLGVSDRTIQRYITSGKLKARRHGLKSFVIKLDELRDFTIANRSFFNESLAQQFSDRQQ